MSEKLTPWFSGYVQPVRIGHYERKYETPSTLHDYWDGTRWFYAGQEDECLFQYRSWRGLASDPAKAKP